MWERAGEWLRIVSAVRRFAASPVLLLVMELFARLRSNPRHVAFVEGGTAREKNGLKITRSRKTQSLRIFFWDLLVSKDGA